MKKRLLALLLTLVMALALTVPAFAAGTKEVVVDEKHGVTITMAEFLRTETHRYVYRDYRDDSCRTMTFYVVADNSTVTIEAMEGRRYKEEGEAWYEGILNDFAYRDDSEYGWLGGEDGNCFAGGLRGRTELLTGPDIRTMTPSEGERFGLNNAYSILFVCESDFAKLVPADTEKPATAAELGLTVTGWAKADVDKALAAGLYDEALGKDMTAGITRAQAAAVAVKLYEAMNGEAMPAKENPFTDTSDPNVVKAYSLGLIDGNGSGRFGPDDQLNREAVAVLLAKVYRKLGGTIPAATTTKFADNGKISSWAKAEVAFMAEQEIVKGDGTNFNPQNDITGQEALILGLQMMNTLK